MAGSSLSGTVILFAVLSETSATTKSMLFVWPLVSVIEAPGTPFAPVRCIIVSVGVIKLTPPVPKSNDEIGLLTNGTIPIPEPKSNCAELVSNKSQLGLIVTDSGPEGTKIGEADTDFDPNRDRPVITIKLHVNRNNFLFLLILLVNVFKRKFTIKIWPTRPPVDSQ